VDDDPAIRGLLGQMLSKKLEIEFHEASTGDEGLRLLEGGEYRLLLTDYMLPGLDGVELIGRARELRGDLPIILISGYANVERTVLAMSAGANHVLEKPVDLQILCQVIQSVLKKPEASIAPAGQGDAGAERLGVRFISSFEGKMLELVDTLDRIAKTDCTVLVLGESGTGKEMVARAIHDRSSRRDGPFIPVHCGAIPETLLESELFGHVRGAFSGAVRDRPGRFALADGGTIFLDEIGEMSPTFQVKLLRVLQERCFDPVGGRSSVHSNFRVLAATHRDLGAMVGEGSFRSDLYYRLAVMELELPALREKSEDLPLLVEHFIGNANRRHGLQIEHCTAAFLEALQGYSFPGNVRELENLIERMCILQGTGPLRARHLPDKFKANPCPVCASATWQLPEEGAKFAEIVEIFENQLIAQALARTNGNKNQAAKILSMNRTTLVEKLKKRGML
jgi:DNA-binding NtrC family response regulator